MGISPNRPITARGTCMEIETFIELIQKIEMLESKHAQKIIAIDGGGGAGKSTFAERLQKGLSNSVIIHIDDFYRGPWNARLDRTDYEINPFFDWDRFKKEVLEPLVAEELIQYHVYNWHTHTADEVRSVPKDAIIILEGGYTTQKAFADMYDFKIWIEAGEDLRLQKALVRDGEHMRFLWEEDWLPVERNYIRIQNPAARADLIIYGHSNDF